MSRPQDVSAASRLLAPDAAATYLGLGSRWAVYRLIATGRLRALKLAGKVRIDREDLDALIEALKTPAEERSIPQMRAVHNGVPSKLAPLPQRRAKTQPPARPMTVPVHDAVHLEVK